MSYCAFFLFVLGALTSISVAVKEQRLLETITSIDKGSPDTAEEKGQNETSIEEYFTSFEKDGIVQAINDLRRTVGAADMTYLDWSTQMENDATTFTAKCSYDSSAVTNGWGIKQWSNVALDPVAELKRFFADSEFYYEMRSVYLLGIGVNIRFCTTARVNGITKYNIYIGCYLFSHTSYFQENYQQYSLGTACTKCHSYVFWCDGGLCRGYPIRRASSEGRLSERRLRKGELLKGACSQKRRSEERAIRRARVQKGDDQKGDDHKGENIG